MYTEIKEMLNFLAVYMHHRIPRRRICLCMENFGNHLAAKFQEKWRPIEPKYAENERIVPIKTLDGLDETFSAIATSNGVFFDDLYDCFPNSIFVYCNPGEVTCRISEFPPTVIIWMGDVNADVEYVPIPLGAAKFYDGNPLNLENTVLIAMRNYPQVPSNGPRNKKIEPERCVPLGLVDTADDGSQDLVVNEFVSIYKIPPLLFRFTTPEMKTFSVRSFAATRFGSHRPRPDHEAMRRIQQAAAYLAMTQQAAAAAAASDNNLATAQYAFGPAGDHAGFGAPYGNQHYPTMPTLPVPNYPSEMSRYNQMPPSNYMHAASAPCVQPSYSTPSFGTFDSTPLDPNPFHNPTNSVHFSSFTPPVTTESTNNFLFWDSVTPVTPAGDLKLDNYNFGLTSDEKHSDHGFTWPCPPSINDLTSPFATGHEIWQPAPTLSSSGNNFTSSNYQLFDTPILAPTASCSSDFSMAARSDPVDSNPIQPFCSPSNTEVDDLQFDMTHLSFLDLPQNSHPDNYGN